MEYIKTTVNNAHTDYWKEQILDAQKDVNEFYTGAGRVKDIDFYNPDDVKRYKDWDAKVHKAKEKVEELIENLEITVRNELSQGTSLTTLQQERLWNICKEQTGYHTISSIEKLYSEIINAIR